MSGFVFGFMWIIPRLDAQWTDYIPPFIAVFILVALTLVSMRTRRSCDIAVLSAIVSIWFAYFIRFYFVAANPAFVHFLVPPAAWSSFDDPDVLKTSFTYLCVALCAFCISAIFFRAMSSSRMKLRLNDGDVRQSVDCVRVSARFIVLTVLAFALLNVVLLSCGIGKMGTFVENPLPFKLTGALLYTKSVIVPCLLVLHIYWAQKARRFVLARFGALVLLLSGLFDMVVFHSRGVLLMQLVIVGLVWLLAGFKLYKFDRIMLVAVLTGCLLIIPVITAMRLYASPLETFSINQAADGLNFVFFRITGIDQLMVILNLGQPLSWDMAQSVLNSPRGVAGYYTMQLLNYAEDIPQTFAPSALGWLYLIGGLPGIIAGSVLLGFLATCGWNVLGRMFPQCAAVAKSYFLVFLLVTITEGLSTVTTRSFLLGTIVLWLMQRYSHIKMRLRSVPQISGN